MYIEIVPKLLLLPPKQVYEVVVNSEVLKTFENKSDAEIYAESIKRHDQKLKVMFLTDPDCQPSASDKHYWADQLKAIENKMLKHE